MKLKTEGTLTDARSEREVSPVFHHLPRDLAKAKALKQICRYL